MIDAPRELDTVQRSLGLRQYADTLWRRKWLVLGVLAACVGLAVGLSLVQAKKYEATTKIVVGQGNGLIPSAYSNAVQPYTATMADLVTSNIVAATVVRELHLPETPQALLNQVSVAINPSTAVMTVNVIDHSASRAVLIAQHVASVFAKLVQERFGSKPTALGGGTVQLPLTATVFDPAHASASPVSPKPTQNAIVAFAIGLVLGLLAAFVREHFDRALRTREAVEESFGVPVIGMVPFKRVRKGEIRPVAWEGHGELAEAFRTLRANLQYLGVRRPLRTILITSAAQEQGKTTVSVNLGVAIARSGSSAVLVDADLRRPRLSEALGAPTLAGLTSVLVGASSAEEALVDVGLVGPIDTSPLGGGQLSLLGPGPSPPNPTELLASAQMSALLERLAVTHDHVVIDSPPLLGLADSLELARMVDGVIIVARRNSATIDDARELRQLVQRSGIRVIGTVFTDVETPRAYGYGDSPRDAPPSRVREAAAVADE
ncbi:MAG: tyrosine-protein kinase domain-containing protein [Gaiellaceae bacterium]